MNKKLLLFRLSIIMFIIISFASSYRLETDADITITFFAVLLSVGYVGAEMVYRRDIVDKE
jgi:hypothetical protein